MNELRQIELEPLPESCPVLSETSRAADSERVSTIDVTIMDLQREVAANRRRLRMLVGFTVGLPVLLVMLSVILLVVARFGMGSEVEPAWFFGLLALIGPSIWLYIRSTRRQRSLAREVAQSDAPMTLGPLIDSLLLPDDRVRREIMDALTRILPGVDAAAARSLTAEQVKILNTQLSRSALDPLYYSSGMDGSASESNSLAGSESVEPPAWRRHTRGQNRAHALVIEVIRAAPMFGNHDTLRWLDRLGRMRVRSRRRVNVASIAAVAAETLRGRLEREGATATLLRPAGPQEHDALLRPASNSSGDNELLLRPHDPIT